MTVLDADTVKKVARLSRIAVDDTAIERLGAQLGGILGWVEQLQEVNTDNVEPLANVADITLKLREDEVTDGGIQDSILANAPEEAEGFFVVNKVVE